MTVDKRRVENLDKYISALQSGEYSGAAARDLYFKHVQDLDSVTPQEAFEIFTRRFQSGESSARILENLDKVINVFHRGLSAYQWEKPGASSFLGILRLENKELIKRLDQISEKLQAGDMVSQRRSILSDISELLEFEDHYLKKENILFPYMEKKEGRYEGVAIMWSLHDEARACLKETIAAFSDGPTAVREEAELSVIIGKLFFVMHGLVQKEEMILFPAAMSLFDEDAFLEMLRQSYEYSFPFVSAADIPDRQDVIKKLQDKNTRTDSSVIKSGLEDYMICSETGNITAQQALMIFSALPVDVSFVDENNKLRFFSRPKDRIFPRSPAALGRDVKNCHPPESVHVVEEIIEAFRTGKQEQASFWIQLKDKFVLIQYFAMRDDNNTYRGVLEVSQDISDIKELHGQRRLLQWDETDN